VGGDQLGQGVSDRDDLAVQRLGLRHGAKAGDCGVCIISLVLGDLGSLHTRVVGGREVSDDGACLGLGHLVGASGLRYGLSSRAESGVSVNDVRGVDLGDLGSRDSSGWLVAAITGSDLDSRGAVVGLVVGPAVSSLVTIAPEGQ
jgi:hypothetical protein